MEIGEIDKVTGKITFHSYTHEDWLKDHNNKIIRNCWGNWQYKPNTHCLVINKIKDRVLWNYDIDLDECTNSAKLLDWIFQIANKTWIEGEDISNLILALDDIFDVQAHYCSCGNNLTFTPKQFLKKQIDPLFKKKPIMI